MEVTVEESKEGSCGSGVDGDAAADVDGSRELVGRGFLQAQLQGTIGVNIEVHAGLDFLVEGGETK